MELITLLLIIVGLCSCDTIQGIAGGNSNGNEEHTHSFANWKVTKNASCTEDGVMEGECSCGEKTTDTLTSAGHSFENGICTVCGATNGNSGNNKHVSSGFEYVTEENEALGRFSAIVGIGTCTDTELVLPETSPDGLPIVLVTLMNCENITKVTIPTSYWGIGSFSGCTSLKEIVLEGAATIVAPESIIGCPSLERITVIENAPVVDNYLFNIGYRHYLDKDCTVKLITINGDLYAEIISPDNEIRLELLVIASTKTRLVLPDTADFIEIDENSVSTNITEIIVPNINVKFIVRNWPLEFGGLATIYFKGSEAEWQEKITFHDGSSYGVDEGGPFFSDYVEEFLEGVTIYYNYTAE